MPLRKHYELGRFQIRINWVVAIAVVMASAGLGRLGIWQLHRAAEKVAAQQALELQLRENAPAIEDIPRGHLHPANPELINRHVSLRGEYENAHTILLLARFFEGQIGYGVVTPLRLQASGELVLVNRGWTTGILPPDTEPSTRPVEGPVQVTAQIYVPPPDARVFPSRVNAGTWPLRLRSLEFDVVSRMLGEPVFPFEVRLTENQPGVLVRYWPAVVADINQHLFYAVQWFSFALIVVAVSLFASSNLWALLRGRNPPSRSPTN